MRGWLGLLTMPRTVTLAVVDRAGRPLGVLPPMEAEPPYWQEVAEIVAGAKTLHGVDLTVLRVLHGTGTDGIAVGGAVTYLAETDDLPPHLRGTVPPLAPHPLRHPYAEPGGPARTLRWAESVLDAGGLGPITATHQLRTWNLSAIWRLDTSSTPYWVKQVPPFLAHEAAVLTWIHARAPHLVPPLLGAADGRMVLGHVPGEDRYGGGLAVREAIDAALHPVQVAASAHVDELLALGVPDGRTPALVSRIADTVAHYGDDPRLRDLVAILPARLAEVARCGVPDTLVHGDLHPGNTRSESDAAPVIVDWGDSFVGHPGFDVLRLAEALGPADADALVRGWADRWRARRPGCEPERAVELLRPVAALRNATVYARFLDHIEPAEHSYHALDVPHWLNLAATHAST
jgi:hypothetical protein